MAAGISIATTRIDQANGGDPPGPDPGALARLESPSSPLVAPGRGTDSAGRVPLDPFRVYLPDELGRDGYSPEWHSTVKHAVREQAGHRCVRCHHPYRRGEHGSGDWTPCDDRCTHEGPVRGVFADGRRSPSWDLRGTLNDPELVGVEAAWRILTVHHLDNVKANCRWWNLVALCQRCHLTIQGRVLMARVWPWEHSAWFRPYVAGYYAFVYLGQELTLEQVTVRLDELLDLERQA